MESTSVFAHLGADNLLAPLPPQVVVASLLFTLCRLFCENNSGSSVADVTKYSRSRALLPNLTLR